MKKILTYVLIASAIIFMLPACNINARKFPDLRESFSKQDKKPFGGYIAYRQVKELYSSNSIRDKKQSFILTWNEISDTAALYVCLTHSLFVNEDEVSAMMKYIYAGNDLFISAGIIDENLLKKINCRTRYNMETVQGFDDLKTTRTSSLVEPESPYSYFYFPFSNYFTKIDTGKTRIVGTNEKGLPNSIVYFYGKGKLYLQCDPRAFSNYFLLKDSNYRYMQHSLAFTAITPQHVYWDDYYHKLRRRRNDNNDRSFSSFGEILKHPPLAYAFWLSLLVLALYILFNGKRVQRVIEQLKPNENTTVTFAETIGRLYLQKKDNKNISDKMIMYFNEYVRNKYFLNSNLVNEEFITALSRKSGVPREKVDSLYQVIHLAQASPAVDDQQLLSLNQQIQNFYKNKK